MTAAAGLADTATESHLKQCAECRGSVQDWKDAVEEFAALHQGPHFEPTDKCPSLEQLANYAAGFIDESAGNLLNHLAECERCAAIISDATAPDQIDKLPFLRSSTREWRRETAAQFLKTSGGSLRVLHYCALAAVLLLFTGIAFWWHTRREPNPATLLSKAYTASRPFEYRLPDNGYSPVSLERGMGSTFTRPRSLIDAEAEINERLSRSKPDSEELELKGRAELLERDYEVAITSLMEALDSDHDRPDLLNDLGCAYALRGDTEKQNLDYGRALEVLLKATRKEPSNEKILFNLALVYEKLSMVDEAVAAWQIVIGLKPPAGWLKEATVRLEALQKIKREKKIADNGVRRNPSDFLNERKLIAAFSPEAYHEVFWQEWLPAAAVNKEAKNAARIVAHMFRLAFLDTSLEDTLATSVGGMNAEGLKKLANAISLNQNGQGDYAAVTARVAVEELQRAGDKAASMRARLELAYSLRRASKLHECLSLTSELVRETEQRHYAWLSGQAHLEHAMCADILGRPGEELAELAVTKLFLNRIGLRTLALRALGVASSTNNLIGNYAAIWDAAPEGLAAYWHNIASPYRAQQFQFDLYSSASALGWREAAIVLCRAAAESAKRANNPEMEAADRVEIAALLTSAGDLREREGEIARAKKLVLELPLGPTSKDLQWTLALKSAASEVAAGRSNTVMADLDQLKGESKFRNPNDQIMFKQALGLAYAATGDLSRASESFREVIDWNQRAVASLHSYADRIPQLETAAESYRNLVQIRLLRNRDPIQALEIWRSYRGVPLTSRESDLRKRYSKAHYRTTAITYAVLPTGIEVWNETGDSVHARLVSAPPSEVRTECERFLRLCSLPTSSEAQIRESGHKLYLWLIKPELMNSPTEGIELDADLWLSSIPFGALTDDSGKYLVQSHFFEEGAQRLPVERSSGQAIKKTSSALFVAAPSGQMPGGKLLPVLGSASAEVAVVAARFSNPTILRDDTASEQAIADHSSEAQIFHFAGHGWANGGNGALVLPYKAGRYSRFLTSKEIEKQNWKHCSLAVLSACLTATGEQRGAVNNQSLVRAMLSAGVRRVVAARWSVDSEATLNLMDQFYALLFEYNSPGGALSGAANHLRVTSKWEHPYYWGGFDVFVGP